MSEENKNIEENKEEFIDDSSSFMEIPTDEGSTAAEQPQTSNLKPQTSN